MASQSALIVSHIERIQSDHSEVEAGLVNKQVLYSQRYTEKVRLEKTKRKRKTCHAKLPQESVAKI